MVAVNEKAVNLWDIFSNSTGLGDNGPYVPSQPGQSLFGAPGTTDGGCVLGRAFGTRELENIPILSVPDVHRGGHYGIGAALGQMGNAFSAADDPIFYLQYANLDRIYWQWQTRNPIKRLCELGGPVIPFDYVLTQGSPVTLDFKINIDVMGPEITVEDLLSTIGGPLSYVYDNI